MQDYANIDGNKIKKIMKATGNVFYQYPNGVIKTGKDAPEVIENNQEEPMKANNTVTGVKPSISGQ